MQKTRHYIASQSNAYKTVTSSIPPVLNVALDTDREEDIAAKLDLENTVLEDGRDLEVVLGEAYTANFETKSTMGPSQETYNPRSRNRW